MWRGTIFKAYRHATGSIRMGILATIATVDPMVVQSKIALYVVRVDIARSNAHWGKHARPHIDIWCLNLLLYCIARLWFIRDRQIIPYITHKLLMWPGRLAGSPDSPVSPTHRFTRLDSLDRYEVRDACRCDTPNSMYILLLVHKTFCFSVTYCPATYNKWDNSVIGHSCIVKGLHTFTVYF